MPSSTKARTGQRSTKAADITPREAEAKRVDVGTVLAQAEQDAKILAKAETVDASDVPTVLATLAEIASVEAKRDAADDTAKQQAETLAGLVKAAHRARWTLLARAYVAAGMPSMAAFGTTLAIPSAQQETLRLHVAAGLWVLLDSGREVTIEAIQAKRLGGIREAKAAMAKASKQAETIRQQAEQAKREAAAKAVAEVKQAEAKADAGETVDVAKVTEQAKAKAAKAVAKATKQAEQADQAAGKQVVRDVAKVRREAKQAEPFTKVDADRLTKAVGKAVAKATERGHASSEQRDAVAAMLAKAAKDMAGAKVQQQAKGKKTA